MAFQSLLPQMANMAVFTTALPFALAIWFNKNAFFAISLYFIWMFMVQEPSGLGQHHLQTVINNSSNCTALCQAQDLDEVLVFHIFWPLLAIAFAILGAWFGSTVGVANMLPVQKLFRAKSSVSGRYFIVAFVSMLVIMFGTHLTYQLLVWSFDLAAVLLLIGIPFILYLALLGVFNGILSKEHIAPVFGKNGERLTLSVLAIGLGHVVINAFVGLTVFFSGSDASWAFWVSFGLFWAVIIVLIILMVAAGRRVREQPKGATRKTNRLTKRKNPWNNNSVV